MSAMSTFLLPSISKGKAENTLCFLLVRDDIVRDCKITVLLLQ